MSTIPVKRVDKNGVLTTKHVRATPKASNDLSGVPAPSLGSAAAPKSSKSGTVAYKPRPGQKVQKPRFFDSDYSVCHKKLMADNEPRESHRRGVEFIFSASEVEMYEVLSVANTGDAIRILNSGVRTADGACGYIRDRNADDAIIDRRELVQEALKRGITSKNFMERMPPPHEQKSPYVLDYIELASLSALSGQLYGFTRQHILDGTIRLEDVKYIGTSKMKSYNRFASTTPALVKLNEPDQPYSLDDVKELVEIAAAEGAADSDYRAALQYMMESGIDTIRGISSLGYFKGILLSHRTGEDKNERIAYEAEFFKVYNRQKNVFAGTELAMKFRAAGVSAADAARLMNDGLDERAVIGVLKDGTEKSLASGWL